MRRRGPNSNTPTLTILGILLLSRDFLMTVAYSMGKKKHVVSTQRLLEWITRYAYGQIKKDLSASISTVVSIPLCTSSAMPPYRSGRSFRTRPRPPSRS